MPWRISASCRTSTLKKSSTPQAEIQNRLNQVFNQQVTNQFGPQRYALLFKPGSYDVDANGQVTALTDGLINLRFLFGFSGSTLVAGALGSGATRTDPAAIIAYLQCLATTMLDVDDNDSIGALTDGLLILRRMFGFSGTALTSNAIGPNAMRTNATDLATFMDQFVP